MKDLTNYISEAIRITADTKPHKEYMYGNLPNLLTKYKFNISQKNLLDDIAFYFDDYNSWDPKQEKEAKELFNQIPKGIKFAEVDEDDGFDINDIIQANKIKKLAVIEHSTFTKPTAELYKVDYVYVIQLADDDNLITYVGN